MATKLKKHEIEIISPSSKVIEDKQYWCKQSMKRIVIPPSIGVIRPNAFAGCHNLKEVYYDGTLEQWVSIIFHHNHIFDHGARFFVKIQELTKGDVDVDYNDDVLPGYEEVTHADLRGVARINDFAFNNCVSVRSIDVTGVGKIGKQAFYGCINLSGKLDLTGVTEIDSEAFGRSQINEITLPLSVTTLSSHPFSECENVAIINCEAKKRPKGWDKGWNYRWWWREDRISVKWGCKID